MNKTTRKGAILAIEMKPPAINMFQVNPAKIAKSKWPAVILAANRTPKEIALAKWDTNSTKTRKGANHKGHPAGKNIAKKLNL